MEQFLGLIDNFVDLYYVLIVIFASETLFNLPFKNASLSRKNSKFKVLFIATAVAAFFYYLHWLEMKTYDPNYLKKLVLSYTFATSTYEIIIKEVKKRLFKKTEEPKEEVIEEPLTQPSPPSDDV